MFGGGVGLFEGGGHFAAGNGDAVLAKDVLRLVLVDFHKGRLPSGRLGLPAKCSGHAERLANELA